MHSSKPQKREIRSSRATKTTPMSMAPSALSNPSSVNPLKKRIRDLTRSLERSDKLPANVRVDNERALAAYKQDLTTAQVQKQRQKMIKKYHMVRFFERRKATRRLRKYRKRLLATPCPEEQRIILDQIHDAEVDLNYTRYCPLDQKYISLYPDEGSEAGQVREAGGAVEVGQAGEDEEEGKDTKRRNKPPLWTTVEQSMKTGTLDALRNGEIRKSHPKPYPTGSTNSMPQSLSGDQPRRSKMGREPPIEDKNSDDTFFEEDDLQVM